MTRKRAAATEDNILRLPKLEKLLEARIEAIESWMEEVWRDPKALLERALELVDPGG